MTTAASRGDGRLAAGQHRRQTDGLSVVKFSARLSVMSDSSVQIYTVSYSYSWPARLLVVSDQLGRRSTVDGRTDFSYKVSYVHLKTAY